MKLTKAKDGNNAIIVRLEEVRPHSNADSLQLATVLGTTVIVGLDAKDGDLMVYFDSNLQLSPAYLNYNNLFRDSELNADKKVSGYFSKNGKVKTIRLREELSDGFVTELETLFFSGKISGSPKDLKEGDEFTHLDGIEVCCKYVVPTSGGAPKAHELAQSWMFKEHWDTQQLMRSKREFSLARYCYVEEKVHGTSGRTGKMLCPTNRPWWKFWAPRDEWRVLSGTRRLPHIRFSIHSTRKKIEEKLARKLYEGETVFYEIFGYDDVGKYIQKGFPYRCFPREYRVMIYRITMTTREGSCRDLSRNQVYRRTKELGFESPVLIRQFDTQADCFDMSMITSLAKGQSYLDENTLLEGVVVWFELPNGSWTCLKLKSPEFLLLDSRNKDKGIGDIEDQN